MTNLSIPIQLHDSTSLSYDKLQTHKKVPYTVATPEQTSNNETRMVTVNIDQCKCRHDNNSRRGPSQSSSSSTIKTILMTSLFFLAVIYFGQSARSVPCGHPGIESVVHKEGDLDFGHVPMREGEIGMIHQRSVRDAPALKTKRDEIKESLFKRKKHKHGKKGSKAKKEKNKKNKKNKKKPRPRRSNRLLQRIMPTFNVEMAAMRERITSVRTEMSAMVDTVRNDVEENRNLIGSVQTGQRIAVHLNCTPAIATVTYSDSYFVWTLREGAPGSLYFRYSTSPDHEMNQNIYGVIINSPGQYQIYSQLLVNGRPQVREHYFPHDCAHQTIRIRRGVATKLLQTYITQYNMGTPFLGDGDTAIKAKDTSVQMGTFYLLRDDEIRINITQGCTHFSYPCDRHASYFGLIRI